MSIRSRKLTRFFIYISGNTKQKIRGCPKAELKLDHSYVFFLNNKTGDHYEVEFEPLAGESEIIIDDLTIICGLKREYPKGKIVRMRGSGGKRQVPFQRGNRGSGQPWKITSYMGFYRE